MTNEDIKGIITAHGGSTTFLSASVSSDTWGHISTTTTGYVLQALVMIMGAADEEVKCGALQVGDIIAFANPSDTNIAYAVQGNFIQYAGNTYKIDNVIKENPINPGDTWSHYEIHAKRIY